MHDIFSNAYTYYVYIWHYRWEITPYLYLPKASVHGSSEADYSIPLSYGA